jgi:AcrR family transcriptional regulator
MTTPTAEANAREINKLKRRERILDAASDLLRESPDGAWTVERVAGRAGVVPRTVFNLVGTRDEMWGALADRLVGDLQSSEIPEDDPQAHARAAVEEMIGRLIADAPVCRALIAGWSQSASKMQRNPIHVVLESLRVAVRSGAIAPGTDVKRLAAHVGDAIAGALHQWGAGLIGTRALRTRCRDAVDIAFAAARPAGANPRWELGSPDRQ